ncbi:MAG: hypothetical protein HYY49_09030, partial [Ignavibacteriales bacterium]|nr:hypothetical protein [Ignavibacteriales bacterium]
MLKEYSQYYSQASAILQRIEDTAHGLQLREKDEAVEVFAAQAVSMSKDHCRAISLLLDVDLFSESIAVCRSLFELCFDTVWINSGDNPAEKLERVYRLEADPYFQMNKEVKLFEEDVKNSTPLTNPEKLEQFRKVLSRTMKANPYLTVSSRQGDLAFRHAPPLLERMGQEFRLQYYHIYRFMCLFTHPSPMLKELHLQNVQLNRPVNEIIEQPLTQVLAYSLLFIEIIAKTAASLI